MALIVEPEVEVVGVVSDMTAEGGIARPGALNCPEAESVGRDRNLWSDELLRIQAHA